MARDTDKVIFDRLNEHGEDIAVLKAHVAALQTLPDKVQAVSDGVNRATVVLEQIKSGQDKALEQINTRLEKAEESGKLIALVTKHPWIAILILPLLFGGGGATLANAIAKMTATPEPVVERK